MLVNFIVAGVQKAGTTSLDAYLRQHPQLSMAKEKEAHFFDNEKLFKTPAPDYEIYHRLFDSSRQGVLFGEATPIYTYWYDSMRRIYQYNPQMRLIVLLRCPMARAWSHWKMEYSRGIDNISFSLAIRNEYERCRAALPYQHRVFSYTSRGFYSEQIRRMLHYFPPGQILFIKSSRLKDEFQPVMDEVCDFLGVDKITFSAEPMHHIGQDLGEIPPEDKKYLIELFRHDVAQVEAMLGWNCGDWLVY